jgi:hypothetical protein
MRCTEQSDNCDLQDLSPHGASAAVTRNYANSVASWRVLFSILEREFGVKNNSVFDEVH